MQKLAEFRRNLNESLEIYRIFMKFNRIIKKSSELIVDLNKSAEILIIQQESK